MCFIFVCECVCVSVYEKNHRYSVCFKSLFRVLTESIYVHSQTMKVFSIHASVCECRQNFYTEGKETHEREKMKGKEKKPNKSDWISEKTQKKCLVLKFIRFQVRRTMPTTTWRRWNHVIQTIWLFVFCYHVVNCPTSSFLVFFFRSLALFSQHHSIFWCYFTLFIFLRRHYYYYFVSPKWNIFITNITFIILASLHTTVYAQLCSPPLSPGSFFPLHLQFIECVFRLRHRNRDTK